MQGKEGLVQGMVNGTLFLYPKELSWFATASVGLMRIVVNGSSQSYQIK